MGLGGTVQRDFLVKSDHSFNSSQQSPQRPLIFYQNEVSDFIRDNVMGGPVWCSEILEKFILAIDLAEFQWK